MADLTDIRARIDEIDTQICDLFAQRMQCTHEVAEYKRESGKPILDRGRERAKLADVATKVPEKLRDYSQVLFSLIMEISRSEQSAELNHRSELAGDIEAALANTPALFPQDAFVACQGVEGAYSQIAADRFFRHPSISYLDSFEGVFRAVEQGLCQYGVLPIENSTAGSVNKVYDLMMEHDFHVTRTSRVRIDHNLLAKPGTRLEDVRDVYSHEQAINQSQAFLSTLPNARVHVVENTAMAAKRVSESDRADVAALSSRPCASLYGLDVLAECVQDRDNNYTRFACISRDLQIFPGADRTSLMVVLNHEPGSLYKMLAKFYALDLNLLKLESRPIPEREFEFMFYFEVAAPVASPEFKTLMTTIGQHCQEYRYLGSYTEVL